MARSPVHIVALFHPADHHYFFELEKHLRILVHQRRVELWSPADVLAGDSVEEATRLRIARADIVLPLISADFMASEDMARLMMQGLSSGRRLIPILVRPADIQGGPLGSRQPLPPNGKPVGTWPDRDEAWLAVVQGLRSVIDFGADEPRTRTQTPPLALPTPVPGTPISQIFTSRQPDLTYVRPSRLPEIESNLRVMGPGLVVEGPSGIGKTTAVRKALDLIGAKARWFSGADEDDVAALDQALSEPLQGHLIVDDFHRLDAARKQRLANKIKVMVDKGTEAKITLIGINPVGLSLTQGLPDLAGRFDVVPLGKESDAKIDELVARGEHAANLRFSLRDEFINAALGSFFTAQRLCAQAARAAGIHKVPPEIQRITLGPVDVMKDVLDQSLRNKYHDALLVITACDETRPPRGAVLVLLWLLSQKLIQRRDGDVSIQEASYQYPDLKPCFDWLRRGNLERCFEQNPILKSLFFYNAGEGRLSIEDPQLEFYLRNLGWLEFARMTGHQGVRLDPEKGLVVTPGQGPAVAADEVLTHVLHLSDLHFGTEEQARIWYDQLAADLRELGCAKLDALIISGDIANRSVPEEYEAARHFLRLLTAEFPLSPQQVVLVPGNHDLNWTLSEDAYTAHRRSSVREKLVEGRFIDGGAYVEVRDEAAYPRRFAHFAKFYKDITGEVYPAEDDQQGLLYHFPAQDLLVLGLNSAWQIDHHFRERASIHVGALGQALTRIRHDPGYAKCLKIAVWHHPLNAPGQDRITDSAFMQALAKAEFRLALHGHIHKSDNSTFRYDMAAGDDGRRIDVISAGTFGAPTVQWLPGYPLQYNLLRISARRVIVETRCREEPNGAWRPDARWLRGPGRDPSPRYEIPLHAG